MSSSRVVLSDTSREIPLKVNVYPSFTASVVPSVDIMSPKVVLPVTAPAVVTVIIEPSTKLVLFSVVKPIAFSNAAFSIYPPSICRIPSTSEAFMPALLLTKSRISPIVLASVTVRLPTSFASLSYRFNVLSASDIELEIPYLSKVVLLVASIVTVSNLFKASEVTYLPEIVLVRFNTEFKSAVPPSSVAFSMVNC